MEWDYFHRTGRYGKAKKLMKRVRKGRKLKWKIIKDKVESGDVKR